MKTGSVTLVYLLPTNNRYRKQKPLRITGRKETFLLCLLIDIMCSMADKRHKKIYKVSRDGKITITPYLVETKEKGKLRLILKRLIYLKKGH